MAKRVVVVVGTNGASLVSRPEDCSSAKVLEKLGRQGSEQRGSQRTCGESQRGVCPGDCPLSLESGVGGYLMESPRETPGEALRGTAEDLVCQFLQNP